MAGYEGDTYNQVVEAEGGMFGGAGADAKAADVSSRRAQAKGESLAEGQDFREGLNPSDQDYLGHPHQDLYDMAHSGDGELVNEKGRILARTRDALRTLGDDLAGAANNEEASWQGQGANQVHGFVRQSAEWVGNTSQGVDLASNRYAQQSGAVVNAQNAMPEPVPFDQAAEMDAAQTQLNSGDISGVTQGMQSMDAMAGKQQASQDAHAQAAQVMHQMDGTLYDTGSTQPAFAAPPTLDGGQPSQPSTGHTQAASATSAPPALGGTAGTAGSAGGAPAGGVPGVGSGPTPGSPAGAGPVTGSGPAQPGGGASGGQAGPGGTSQGAGRGGVGGPMAAAAGGNAANTGAETPRRTPRPGLGSTAGSRVSGGSGAKSGAGESRGSAASRLGESKTGGGKQGGAAGRAVGNEPGAGKGTGSAPTEKAPKEGIARGGQAASGGKGTGPAGAGMPGGGRGGKDEDKEHQRPSYLKEDDPESIFETRPDEGPDGERPVPPTIGT